jgi:hypothetical protein
LFEPAVVERPTRSRKAVPSVISDPTPRSISAGDSGFPIVENGSSNDGELVATADDALSRARARRRNAGYARASV